jgi:hypothetical protein
MMHAVRMISRVISFPLSLEEVVRRPRILVQSVLAGQAPPEPGGGGEEDPCSTCVSSSMAGSP